MVLLLSTMLLVESRPSPHTLPSFSRAHRYAKVEENQSNSCPPFPRSPSHEGGGTW
jgi:hypothetical protein